jgi:hypothetical protein
MRLFFMRSIKKLQTDIECRSYPKIHASHLSNQGRSIFSGYVVIFHNHQAQFFSTRRTVSTLIRLITWVFDRSFRGCFVTVILNSLNYFVKRFGWFARGRRKLRLDLHFSRKVILPVPPSVIVRIFKKRISLFGLPENVIPFVYILTHLRRFDVYTGYGVRIPYSGAKKKPGKVRLR